MYIKKKFINLLKHIILKKEYKVIKKRIIKSFNTSSVLVATTKQYKYYLVTLDFIRKRGLLNEYLKKQEQYIKTKDFILYKIDKKIEWIRKVCDECDNPEKIFEYIDTYYEPLKINSSRRCVFFSNEELTDEYIIDGIMLDSLIKKYELSYELCKKEYFTNTNYITRDEYRGIHFTLVESEKIYNKVMDYIKTLTKDNDDTQS